MEGEKEIGTKTQVDKEEIVEKYLPFFYFLWEYYFVRFQVPA